MSYVVQQAWHRRMFYHDMYLVQVAEYPEIHFQADPKYTLYVSFNNGTDGSWRNVPKLDKIKKGSSIEDKLIQAVWSMKEKR